MIQKITKGLTRVNRIPHHTMARKTKLSNSESGISELLGQLRDLIQQARQQALRAVDLMQVAVKMTQSYHQFQNLDAVSLKAAQKNTSGLA